MILETLYISKNASWVANPGEYSGNITFKSSSGEVKINVSHAVSARILSIVAEEIVAAAKSLSSILASEVIEQVSFPSIEK